MKNLLALFILLLSISALGQRVIDLSENVNNEVVTSVNHNELFSLKLINRLPHPNARYEIEILKETIPIQEIEIEGAFKHVPDEPGGMSKCARLTALASELYSTQNESDIPEKISELESEMEKLIPGIAEGESNVDGCEQQHFKAYRKIIAQTKSQLWTGELKRGERLKVTISRKVKEDSVLTWTNVFTTEPRGEWQVSYGFSFAGQSWNKENLYYSATTDTVFTITKKENRKKLEFIPSVFFSWQPAWSMNRSYGISLSGGLGFDLEDPTVFLGATVSYNQNIKIHFGAVAHKQYSLKGQYKENQILQENLDLESLHEKHYVFNPFISVSFRLDKNPFKKE